MLHDEHMQAKAEGIVAIPSPDLQPICLGEPESSAKTALACLSALNSIGTMIQDAGLTSSCRALGSTIVTIPFTWYLMQPQIERWNRPKGSGHGEHGHGEHKEAGESHEEEESSEKGGDEFVEGDKGSKEGGDDGESSDDPGVESGDNDTPDTSDDEERVVDSSKNAEGVQFKGASNAGPNKEQSDTRKHIPDAKGGAKKRIESHYGQRQGVAEDPEQDPANQDKVFKLLSFLNS